MVGPGKIRDGTKSLCRWPARLMIIVLMLIMCSSMLLVRVNAETITEEPSRVINLVYDDSGSMVQVDDQGTKTDAWCQAKYGVEVLAAMLGKKDRLNIYVMSDIKKNPDAGPHLQLDGSNGAAENVAQVHKMVTELCGVPF